MSGTAPPGSSDPPRQGTDALGIPARRGSQPAPLAAAQRRLWLLHQIHPESSVGNRPVAIRLTGPLNRSALERALGEIVRRHQALRTVFRELDAEPVQIVLPAVPPALDSVDLESRPEDEREQEARRIAAAESRRPFDLGAGPLCRVVLLRLAAEDHVLLVLLHHIVFDAWSEGVLLRELACLYAAYAAGKESPLTEPVIQYPDYAEWQAGRLDSRLVEQQVEFWRGRLEPLPPHLVLPTDFPPPSAPITEGGEVTLLLPNDDRARFRTWCRRQRVTPFMALLAAFQALLSRWAGQHQFVVGVPVAGRTHAEIEGLIGCFMNVLPLRADLSRNPTFLEVLDAIRELTLSSFDQQELPLERLIEALRPERRPNRWPMFDVMFNLRSVPVTKASRAAGLQMRPFAFDRGTLDRLSLYLHAQDEPEGLRFVFTYPTELFRQDTVEQMAESFRILLQAALDHPDRRVSRLPLLGDAARRRILVEWNRTASPYPRKLCVHHLVEAQVSRSPSAIAVTSGSEKLSYAALNRRANHLALRLRNTGVGPEVVVALLLERSPDFVVAALAVLKAGGAYLPLEPASPPERLQFMLADSGARVVLTEERLVAKLPPSGAQVLALDRANSRTESEESLESGVEPENLAYVLYTSGSAGRPKAVMVTHRSLCNHLSWRCGRFELTAEDRVLHSASLGFDDAVWETFEPLMSGAQLVLAPPSAELDLPQLVRVMREAGVTVACFVPSLLRAIVEEPELAQCRSLARVGTGGEVLSPELEARFFARLNASLFNGYGPAETTIASSFWECRSELRTHTVPIGRPIANTQMYVLDPELEPVPIGVVGEVFIGGEGVARGYLACPAATADRFVPDPFGPSGGRLFRTGDFARMRPDGALEFVGRIDAQIKIRGCRVELGEIEAALRGHATVRDAAAAPYQDGAGGVRLVAYVVPAEPGGLVVAELRAHLRQRLPEYMIPGDLVPVVALPRTPSGKLDRRALPALDSLPSDLDAPFEPPATEVEQQLARIWAELLRRDRVGRHEDFFALGGHSLTATTLVARARAVWDIELPLRAIFEAPTVAALAARIQALRSQPRAADAETKPAEGDALVFPTSFAQRRLWMVDQLQPHSSTYNIPCALRLHGGLRPAVLEQALNALVERHESLRTRIVEVDGIPMQLVDSRLTVPLPVIDVANGEGVDHWAEVKGLFLAEANLPFDLAQGPLLRARLLRLAPDEHVLVLVIHHIVSDAWSISVLLQELGQCYGNLLRGRAPQLPELPVQYADYTLWQHQFLSGDELARQLGYWQQHLAGAPPVLQLPCDRPRSAVPSSRGAWFEHTLDPPLVASLRELSRGERATLFMALLAGFAALLGRYSCQASVVVGTPIAGRTRVELEGLIGFFVNTLALRIEVDGRPSFRTLLRRVREVALGAYGHQDLPFERLVEALQPERSVLHHPIFQVLFQLVNAPAQELRLAGLEVQPFEIDPGRAKFDLSLSLKEQLEGVRCRCTFRLDLFDPSTIQRLVQEYQRLLERAVAEPDAPIAFSGPPTEESGPLLPDPRAPLPAPSYPGALESIAVRVRSSPEACAIDDGAGYRSYAELADSVESVRAQLRQAGVARGDVIALTGAPSFGLIAAMIGALAGGGVIVPLDPRLPGRRREMMLKESRATVLLRVASPAEPATAHPPEALLLLDVDPRTGRIASRPTLGADHSSPAPDDPAYIFCTSGTTGAPRAVLGVHKSLAHFLAWERQTFDIGPGDRCAQLTSLSFDPVLRDVFLPLTSGATLCLPPAELPAERVLEWIASAGITVLHAVPSLSSLWLDEYRGGRRIGSLRWVFLAGEPLSDTLVRRWREVLSPDCGIVNLYGPTEATMVKCFHQVLGEPLPGVQPVGRPLPDTQALVLDESGRLCGVRQYGEVVLRTPFLTRGYLNAPQEQSARFVTNPFRDDPADLLYHTGDLGWYRDDGTLAILGRRDDQVKINGVRVEPAEVAAVLAQHEAVRECAVLAEGAEPQGAALVAFVVPRSPTPREAFQAFLAQRLPSAMVPPSFVFLDQLPRTSNGKLDRSALAEAAARSPGTIRELIDSMARDRQDAVFLLAPGSQREVSFGGLQATAHEIGSRLSALGVAPGGKVAYLMDNGVFTAELYLGILYAGRMPVPLGPSWGEAFIAQVLTDCEAAVALVSAEHAELLQGALGRAGREMRVIRADPDHGADWLSEELQHYPLPPLTRGDDADLVYTSGTTGAPKGVIASHAGLLAGAATSARAYRLSQKDRALCVTPLSRRSAQVSTLLATLQVGGSVVLPRRFNPGTFWTWADDLGCTWVSLVPTLVSRLLLPDAPPRTGAQASRLRFVRTSSAPLPAPLQPAFEERFGVPLIQAMGMTEAGGTIFAQPLPPLAGKPGSVGVAQGFRVKVLDSAGKELPAGTVGEIVVRGPSLMKRYHHDPEATAAVLGPDGWLRTGDLGYRDEEGHFFIAGRLKDLIIKGGENVAPREIERVLGRHPAVLEAAVAGRRDPYLGQEIVAYVVPRPGAHFREEEVLDFCERELGGFKRPARIYRVSELPRTAAGQLVPSALPADPGGSGPGAHSTAAGASPSSTEQIVGRIWEEVLQREGIKAEDDFFALGGHSLLAMKVVSRVRRLCGCEVEVGAIFESPRLGDFARRVQATRPVELAGAS